MIKYMYTYVLGFVVLAAATVGFYVYNQPTFVAVAEQGGEKVLLSSEQRNCRPGELFVRYVPVQGKSVDGCGAILPQGLLIRYEDGDGGRIGMHYFKPIK